MWTVAFPGSLYRDMRKLLFSAAPRENGCFLLARHYRTKKSAGLLVAGILEPDDDSWNRASNLDLEPSSTFVNRCAVRADEGDFGLIFVHTHPCPGRAEFSAIDKKSNARLLENLAQMFPGRPMGSLVFGADDACGVVRDVDGVFYTAVRIRAAGRTLDYPSALRGDSPAMFDRQTRALGRRAQARLQDLFVSVVGAGGTGSSVAVQLARMGVGRLRLVDMDTVDPTNLPRVYGATDADVGKHKAAVVGEHISSISACDVEAVCADASNEGVRDALIESDVMFACTDNLTSRCVLNEISSRYLVPLIDVGCRIRLADGGGVEQAAAKVQAVTPDGPCLWCTGTLDGRLILQESLSTREQTLLANEGYYDGLGAQPSVVSMTTMAASMAINKLIGMLGVFGSNQDSRQQVEIKDGFAISDSPAVQDNCICMTTKGIPFRDR